MNTRQKAVIGVGLAVVIAMALYPPWATWCIPVDDRDLQVQYGWLFGRLNYPDCAEKLPWAWGLATDRLLLQCGLVILATVALTVAFQPKDTGRTRLAMNGHPPSSDHSSGPKYGERNRCIRLEYGRRP